MIKVTNVNIGHLYNISDFMWHKIEQSYDSTYQQSGLFYYDNPKHFSQGRRRLFLALTWILQLIL
jgi:hypothetical protein